MDKIKEKFSLICDTRYQSYVEHKLSDILVITMCAVLCGIDSLNGIVSYAENKKDTGSVVAVDVKAVRSTAEKGKPILPSPGFNCILYRKQRCTGTGSST